MKPGIAAGAVAGAVGTIALDVVAYGDMLVRGRAASELPGVAAGTLTERVGIELDPNRKHALGAILGYLTGVAVGGLLGGVWGGRRARTARRGLTAAVTAMAVANTPMVAQGLTDPRTWGVAGWVSDIVPHVAYGLATAATYERITA